MQLTVPRAYQITVFNRGTDDGWLCYDVARPASTKHNADTYKWSSSNDITTRSESTPKRGNNAVQRAGG